MLRARARGRVLVVEDDSPIRVMLSDRLQDAGSVSSRRAMGLRPWSICVRLGLT